MAQNTDLYIKAPILTVVEGWGCKCFVYMGL